MLITRCLLLTGLALTGITAATQSVAQERFGGSLALTSNYVYHGISQTCGDPAAQADLHFRLSGGQSPSETFVGTWGSAGLGSTHCTAAKEVNIYGGHSFATGKNSSATLTYVHYAFPGGGGIYAPFTGERYDYDEIGVTWAYEDELYLTFAYTPDAFHHSQYDPERNRSAISYGLQLHRPLFGALTASFGLGYDEITDPSDTGYGFGNVGIGYSLGKVQLDLAYFRAAPRAEYLFGYEVGGGNVSATAVWRF
jgi:uncharacterized protein (TIGR02001 family)